MDKETELDLQPECLLDPSLVFYLPLWKKDGTTISSEDGYGHTCTVTGATWRTQGRSTDGTSNIIDCGNVSVLANAFGGDTTGAYTYIWWVKHTAWTPNRGLLVKGADPAFWGLWTNTPVATPVLSWEMKVTGVTNDLLVTWNISETTTNWNQFVLTGSGRASAGWTLYINGIAKTMTVTYDTLSANVANTTSTLYIPGRAWGASGYFSGIMGDVLVYNRTFSVNEIMLNYLATKFRYQ